MEQFLLNLTNYVLALPSIILAKVKTANDSTFAQVGAWMRARLDEKLDVTGTAANSAKLGGSTKGEIVASLNAYADEKSQAAKDIAIAATGAAAVADGKAVGAVAAIAALGTTVSDNKTAIELALAAEKDRLDEAISQAKADVKGFYHIATTSGNAQTDLEAAIAADPLLQKAVTGRYALVYTGATPGVVTGVGPTGYVVKQNDTVLVTVTANATGIATFTGNENVLHDNNGASYADVQSAIAPIATSINNLEVAQAALAANFSLAATSFAGTVSATIGDSFSAFTGN